MGHGIAGSRQVIDVLFQSRSDFDRLVEHIVEVGKTASGTPPYLVRRPVLVPFWARLAPRSPRADPASDAGWLSTRRRRADAWRIL